jgi:hypothetical protein
MVEITQYTRQVQPSDTQRTQATPQAFGAGIGEQIAGVGDQVQTIKNRRDARMDVINTARALEKFSMESDSDFSETMAGSDLVDPSTSKEYNRRVRERSNAILEEFGGSLSADAAAQLAARLESAQGGYISNMNATALGHQRKFILDTANKELTPLIEMVSNDPSMINEAQGQLMDILNRNSKAMYPEDEISFMDAASDTLARKALDSYVDSGKYREAKELIDNNPFIINSLMPQTKENIVKVISAGLAEENKAIREARTKAATVKSMASELGVEVSPEQLFTASTDIELKDNPMANLKEYAKFMGKDVTELPPNVVAKHGFGIDLGAGGIESAEAKNIIKFINKPVEESVQVRTLVNGVIDQGQEFLDSGNPQASLASLIAFQKLIDDGAAVREGDIKLSAEGISAFDKLELQMKKISEGGIATREQVLDMIESAKIFANAALEPRKNIIDPYLADAQSLGLAPRKVGIPQQSYDMLFDGVQTDTDRKAQGTEQFDQISKIAEENGMSVDDLIKSTAAATGKTEEEVRKDFNL